MSRGVMTRPIERGASIAVILRPCRIAYKSRDAPALSAKAAFVARGNSNPMADIP